MPICAFEKIGNTNQNHVGFSYIFLPSSYANVIIIIKFRCALIESANDLKEKKTKEALHFTF